MRANPQPNYVKVIELPDAMIEHRLHHVFWIVADYPDDVTETWTMMFTGPFALKKVIDVLRKSYPDIQLLVQRMLILDARSDAGF